MRQTKNQKDLTIFSKRAKESTVSYEELLKKLKLSADEKKILGAYERGELKTVKDFKKESKLIQQAAAHTLKSICNSKRLK